MENVSQQAVEFLTVWGIRVVGAIIILVVGRIVAGFIRKGIARAMERGKVDATLIAFFARLAYILIMVFVVLAALGKFGVQTMSVVAVLGAAGFAVAFAMKDSLGNFAAGVMIIAFRPFGVGDFVDAAGVSGTVKEIRLFTTIMATPDNVKIIVPNGAIFGGNIKNFSANATRRVDLVVRIGYDSPIGKAEEIMEGLIKADERILGDPEHMIAVSELADSSVNFVVRVWVNRADYWNVKCDLTRAIKEAFDENGIEIPFPQQVVHHVNMA